jgi:hypothetical protein
MLGRLVRIRDIRKKDVEGWFYIDMRAALDEHVHGTSRRSPAKSCRTLAVAPDVEVTVRIEVEASTPQGFAGAKVRTVAENALTLELDRSGFEEAGKAAGNQRISSSALPTSEWKSSSARQRWSVTSEK